MALQAIATPKTNPTTCDALLVGLHGWGANAADLAALGEFLTLPHCHMVFPDAPFPHPQSPGGRMWYGFPNSYDFRQAHDFEQQSDLCTSRQALNAWLQQITAETGIPLERTIVAGFSQGGAMALDVGLQLPVAAVLVLSGYLHGAIFSHHPPSPVLLVHGRQDPVVPLACAHQTRQVLQAQQVPVTYHEQDMGHEIQPVVLQHIERFYQAWRQAQAVGNKAGE
ncbi:MAG: esterase [Cyanobacteria bacterium]|nr:esterase [Cyanobacteriota bacterium]